MTHRKKKATSANVAKETKSAMASLMAKAGFNLSDEQLERFWAFYGLLVRYNRELDLSRLVKFEDIVVKHFIDSIYVSRLYELTPPLLDIGTGAGFPGIPLKIISPGMKIILAEPRHKRVAFLKKVIEELGLADAEIYPHLVGEHSSFAVTTVITRALESVEDTLTRVRHFLPRGGKVVFMKGPAAQQDLEELSERNREMFSAAADREYILPGSRHRRRLLVMEKQEDYRRETYRIMKRAGESPGREITSDDNKTFRDFKKITTVEGIKKTGRMLVAGRKEVLDLHGRHPSLGRSLIIRDGYAEERPEMRELIEEYRGRDRLYILRKGLFGELDIFNTASPLLEAETPPVPPWEPGSGVGCTLLVPFQDPSNVGAVVRSAAAFGAGEIVLLKEAAHPFHPRAVRSSGGTVFYGPLKRGPSLQEAADLCASRSLPLIALDAGGESIENFTFPERFLLLPGVEGPGLPAMLRARAVSIPMSGGVESLNAAVAVSIALYAWRTQG
ncbi:MAG TPA: 16S rRNA (guanine(527)-N(7))-methyltransferase RsmG [Spirochaetes bacterium]|mgnify:CR=1 FL=1|nr:16S rRNA (guanine(527)-N(7))-methyltransferase RsmG [Spirochaetota bacterium]